jgi:hypothetical protein
MLHAVAHHKVPAGYKPFVDGVGFPKSKRVHLTPRHNYIPQLAIGTIAPPSVRVAQIPPEGDHEAPSGIVPSHAIPSFHVSPASVQAPQLPILGRSVGAKIVYGDEALNNRRVESLFPAPLQQKVAPAPTLNHFDNVTAIKLDNQAQTIGATSSGDPNISGSKFPADKALFKSEVNFFKDNGPPSLHFGPESSGKSGLLSLSNSPAPFTEKGVNAYAPISTAHFGGFSTRDASSTDTNNREDPQPRNSAGDAPTRTVGSIFLDGSQLGEWMTRHLEGVLNHAPVGSTSVDSRYIAPWFGNI